MTDKQKIEKLDENKSSSIRIEKIKLTNYRFFYEEFELDCKGQNVLIYGENGTGKSSIYKALELLTKKDFKSIQESRNIFGEEGNPEISFTFSNTDPNELILNSEVDESIFEGFEFLKGLSIFSPMMDYKKLLKVHYSAANGDKKINVYNMLRELFRDYPVKNGETLSSISNPLRQSKELETILNEILLKDTNDILREFDKDLSIAGFKFDTASGERPDQMINVINIIANYKDRPLEKYHSFLNEARLSALAMSIYFASIHMLIDSISIKILVLDDLVISLDMSNRKKVLDILEKKFQDFQIFFFTHDTELYEIFKGKFFKLSYELYVDDIGEIPKCITIEGKTHLENAKKYYAMKEIAACGLMLRKALEKQLKDFIPKKDRRYIDKNTDDFVDFDLFRLINKAGQMVNNQQAEKIIKKAHFDRKYILNKLAHEDYTNIYISELKQAIEDVEKLEIFLTPNAETK